MAAAEHLPDAEPALVHLIQHRFLLSGDEEQNLWLSPVLRRYVYLRQTKLDLAARHWRIAAYFLAEDNPLAAARHLQAAQRWDAAADLLLTAADELVNELHADDLLRGLEAFKRNHLAADQWREVQILAPTYTVSAAATTMRWPRVVPRCAPPTPPLTRRALPADGQAL